MMGYVISLDGGSWVIGFARGLWDPCVMYPCMLSSMSAETEDGQWQEVGCSLFEAAVRDLWGAVD